MALMSFINIAWQGGNFSLLFPYTRVSKYIRGPLSISQQQQQQEKQGSSFTVYQYDLMCFAYFVSCSTRCVKPYPHLLDLPEIWSPEAGGVERQAVPPELGQEVADGVPGGQ